MAGVGRERHRAQQRCRPTLRGDRLPGAAFEVALVIPRPNARQRRVRGEQVARGAEQQALLRVIVEPHRATRRPGVARAPVRRGCSSGSPPSPRQWFANGLRRTRTAGSRGHARGRTRATVERNRFRWPPALSVDRSWPSAVMATSQPRFSGPNRWSAGMRTSVRKSSLKPEAPLNWRIGRTSTPVVRRSSKNAEIPRCLGAFGSVRASSSIQSE